MKTVSGKSNFVLTACLALFFSMAHLTPAPAQAVLFDFDNLSGGSGLPGSLTVGGITAHFSATGQGYSIQNANTMGFTPSGFGGLCIYPSSVFLADLLISFDQTLTDFSILYACQELACDDAATMRVTAYMNSVYVGTNTRTATFPGTWPSDTLSCSFAQGFNNVVVHYDAKPPTCQDWGPIFMADNMRVTAFDITAIINPKTPVEELIVNNPVSQTAIISFSLLQTSAIRVTVYDITGRAIKNLFDNTLCSGEHQLNWDVKSDAVKSGIYILNLAGENFSLSCKVVVVN